MTNDGERVYLQCDPYDTGILDLDNYPNLLAALEPDVAVIAQQIFEDFILSECKLVMTKADFLLKFAGLRPAKPPLAAKRHTPKVFLNLSDTVPLKENTEFATSDIKEIFSRRLNFVHKVSESPRPVLKPANKPRRVT